MRKLIEASTRTIESIHDDDSEDVRVILDKAEADIFSIASDTKKNEGLIKIGPIVNEWSILFITRKIITFQISF